MDNLALRSSPAVGLLLNNDEERRLVRSAALSAGLEPVNPAEFRGGLQLIVADDEEAISANANLWQGDSPLILLIHDEAKPGLLYPWVLTRPLQEEVVTAQLLRAAYANQIFATRHHSMLDELHRSRRIFDSIAHSVTIADARGLDLPLVYVNAAFERMTGYTADQACGRNCRFLQGTDTDQPCMAEVRRAIREKDEACVLVKNYRKDGTPFWNELTLSPILDLEGVVTHFVGVQKDVTKQVESARRLDHLASHDYLTDLANRSLLMEQLKHALLRARRKGANVAVLFFDLDDFKHVNDVFGHEAGDRLLQVVANRLRAESRGGEVVARLGGDEFVVVLEGFEDERRPYAVMHRLTAKVSEMVELVDQQFHPRASAGMALFPQDGDTSEALLRVADFNMYAAKHRRREEPSKPT